MQGTAADALGNGPAGEQPGIAWRRVLAWLMALVQRALEERDLDQVWDLEREAFHVDPGDEPRWRKWERLIGLERIEGLFLDGRLLATSAVLGLGQWFGGRSVPMGGVRAVAVRAEHRGRGHATRVVRACLEAMRARGEAISVLYPQVVRPYRRLGWEVAGTLLFRQVPARALLPLATAAPPARRATEADHGAIRAVYDQVARRANGWVDRPAGRWDWLFDRFRDDHLFVTADGYVAYRAIDKPPAGPEGFRLLVLELAATAPAAWQALWGLLGRASSVVPTVFYRSGPADPLAGRLDGLEVSVARERVWMLRLVDAQAAIAARGYPEEVRGAVALDVADPSCPWNAGPHTLVVDGGRGRLEPNGTGGVRLGIGALSALFSGWSTTAALAATGLLDGGSERDRGTLDRIFAGPTPWMVDEF